ncbi:NYN domain-containing protein [Duganella sp. FT80W]|uniref:NYN domain-containing protein n=1 Tax=Duganella guangzhouensis TaxID=2666084 RepID=A0A6I2L008_9BURK|nr:NYN domain-containing protein [Duganella guangzhouensis]MRW91130.1 NYN domain-containing protein [Duganella guangzhouensis]
MKTIVYVDGWNLYYGLLRRSAYKWLDLFSLFQNHVLIPDAEICEVRYYTAPLLARLCDDPASPQRQSLYLQALKKMPPQKVRIIEGALELSTSYLRLVHPPSDAERVALVYKMTEKKSDVNLAADLISGAFLGQCEQAVVCTNDSDLAPAMAAVRLHCPHVRLGLVVPIPGTDHRRAGRDLVRHAHWFKLLSTVHLARAQLPTKIPHTSIYQPQLWRAR